MDLYSRRNCSLLSSQGINSLELYEEYENTFNKGILSEYRKKKTSTEFPAGIDDDAIFTVMRKLPKTKCYF